MGAGCFQRGDPFARLRPMCRSAVFVLLLSGCYAYTPIEPASARPGMEVRARVSATAAERIAPLLGASEARVLTGSLIDNQPDGMVVEVPTVVQTDVGTSIQILHQRLSIGRGDLMELEARKLDRMRTGALAGAGAIVVGAIVIKALNGGPAKEPLPGGGASEVRIPLWSLPLPD